MRAMLMTVATLAILATVAEAQVRSDRTTTGPRGVTSEAATEVTRDGDTRSRITTVTRSDGTGYTREGSVTWDPETGSWTRQGSGSGTAGSWSSSGEGGCVDLACTSTGTATGPRGTTVGTEATRDFSTQGRVTGSRRWQGPRGGQSTRSWRRVR